MMKMFSPEPSETWPSSLSMIASSKPAVSASVLARAELMYAPVTLARTGIDWSSVRRQDEVTTCTPPVVSR